MSEKKLFDKQFKKRALSMLTSATLIMSSAALPAFAAGFTDVDSDPTVSWAKPSIDKMTDAGYIKGMGDGTFAPYKSISKIECLLLMSRMLGYEDKTYADFVSAAKSAYKDTASKYNKTYSGELSYLLYTGVLKESELADYASMANANTALSRYQAAMLMAKLMGADEEAKSYTVDKPTYADDASIPTNAKPYVEYVSANNIMNGMDKTATGEPQFSPTTSLTRAQTATLLARMIDTLDTKLVSGTVEAVKSNKFTIDGTKVKFADDTSVLIGGKKGSTSSITEGYTVSALSVCEKAFAIIAEEPKEETILYGDIVRKGESPDGKTITIADHENSDNSQVYTLLDNCEVYVKGSKANISDIMANDFVKIILSGSKVKSIETADKTIEVKGILESVDFDDNDNVYLNVAEKEGEKAQQYTVSSKGADITRDDEDAEFTDLAKGDTIELKLSYGKITKITATGQTETVTGNLKEIIISSNPAITVTVDGKDKTYKFATKNKIYIADKASTIYDLRPNVTVSVKLDNDLVKSLSTSTVPLNEKGELTGVVTGKNTSYKVISVKDEAGNTQSVYYNNNTKFLTSSGSNTTIKSISEGSNLSITGNTSNGIFEASIIIIK